MTVRQIPYSNEEFALRGSEINEREIRPQLESESMGKFVDIDIESGNQDSDEDDFTATQRLIQDIPDARICLNHAGHKAAYKFGGPCPSDAAA